MKYYIKIRGNVRGPFESSQIATFLQQGKIGKYNELSIDRKNWARASEFSEFFQRLEPASGGDSSNVDDELAIVESDGEPRPFEADSAFEPRAAARRSSYDENSTPPSKTKPNSRSKSDAATSTDENAVWFVSNDGVTGTGPYSAREIWRLLEKGKAAPDSLVWLEGLPARPLKDVPEFGKAESGAANDETTDSARAGVALQGETLCSKCGAPIASDAAFCPKCGASKPTDASGPTRKCSRCQADVSLRAKVCPNCGRSLVRKIRKSRLIYIIAGLFGGLVGTHNFYARRFGEGRRQLTFFILGVVLLVFRGFAPDILAAIPNGDRISLERLDLLLKIAGRVLIGLVGLWTILNVILASEDGDGLPFEPIVPAASDDAKSDEEN